jgi:signal peptidase
MKILKRLGSILFYATAIFLILFIVFEVFMPNKTIDYLGVKTYVILTPSMEPDINVNDMIVVRKIKEEEIEVGDAISFQVYIRDLGRDAVVTHYVGDIIDEQGDLIYKTRGATAEEDVFDVWLNEQNEEIDITYDDIVGVVLFRVPYAGYIVKITQNPVMLGLIGLNIVIIYALVKVIKYKPKKD